MLLKYDYIILQTFRISSYLRDLSLFIIPKAFYYTSARILVPYGYIYPLHALCYRDILPN